MEKNLSAKACNLEKHMDGEYDNHGLELYRCKEQKEGIALPTRYRVHTFVMADEF